MRMITRSRCLTAALASAALVLTACGASKLNVRDQQDGSPLVGVTGVYTLTNLHPDPVNQRLYTVNYQQPGLIPVCTEVMITEATTKAAIFKTVDDDRRYEYIRHKTLAKPFDQHLQQFFGKDCPDDKIAKMSKVDREGIEDGTAKLGMTKEGVLIAMGPPPSHATPSLESDSWMYWQNRFGRKRIDFENGKVVKIVD